MPCMQQSIQVLHTWAEAVLVGLELSELSGIDLYSQWCEDR